MEERRRREDVLFDLLRNDIKDVNAGLKYDIREIKTQLKFDIEQVSEKLDKLSDMTHKNSSRITRLEVITGFITSIGTAIGGWLGFHGK